jgi:hypothetical protein
MNKDNRTLVSFKNFKDSGPLLVYFANEVENKISAFFSGRVIDLKSAAENLSSYPADIQETYDIIVQFDVLSKIWVVLLFNDKDDEFDAQAKSCLSKEPKTT